MADISRTTSGVVLPVDVSNEIWGQVLEQSAIMQLARTATIPGTGTTIQTITGEPAADWVSETAAKPIATHTFSSKAITPYKLAVIEPFSMEFRRDKAALYNECIRRLPFALSSKFDATVMGTTAPGTGFDTLGACTTVDISTDTWEAFVSVDAAIAAAGGIMDGIALAPQGKSIVLAETDNIGRPLFIPDTTAGMVGNILGAPVTVKKGVYVAGTPNIVGIAGDFNDACVYYVNNVTLSISDQATLTTSGGSTINLWQQNMFAVRAEIELAFAVRNTGEFVLLADGTAGDGEGE